LNVESAVLWVSIVLGFDYFLPIKLFRVTVHNNKVMITSKRRDEMLKQF